MYSKKTARSITAIAAVFAAVFALLACSAPLPDDRPEQEKPASGEISLAIRPTDGVYDIHTPIQQEYLSGPYQTRPENAFGLAENSKPQGVTVEWELFVPDGKASEIKELKLELAKGGDLSGRDVQKFTLSPTATEYTFNNLFLHTNYVWKLSVIGEGGNVIASDGSSFTTGGGIRNMSVGGVTNVRDMGGKEREDGTLVKQGMIYRTGRLNDSWSKVVRPNITESGKKVMLDTMKIKTEIDLRGQADDSRGTERGGLTDKSLLGDSVSYRYIGLSWSYSFNDKEQLKEIFSIFGDPDRYPIIFHCSIGTDRTGMIAFLINSLMGIAEEDIYRDYMFSNFANIEGPRGSDAIDNLFDTVCSYNGDTLSQKVEDLLVSYVGVPKSDIDSMRSLLSCDDRPVSEPAKKDVTAKARRYSLGGGSYVLDDIPGVAAWTRYAKTVVTQRAGSETLLPTEGDTVRTLTDTSDNYAYRNSSQSVTRNINVNGSSGALVIGSAAKAASVGYTAKARDRAAIPVNADGHTAKIIVYCGSHIGRTNVYLRDQNGAVLATTSLHPTGNSSKGACRIEFTVTASRAARLTVELHAETAYATYIAAIAVTAK